MVGDSAGGPMFILSHGRISLSSLGVNNKGLFCHVVEPISLLWCQCLKGFMFYIIHKLKKHNHYGLNVLYYTRTQEAQLSWS